MENRPQLFAWNVGERPKPWGIHWIYQLVVSCSEAQDSTLFNSMALPFFSYNIYGALWYQVSSV